MKVQGHLWRGDLPDRLRTNQDLREEAQHDVQSQGLSIQGPFTLCFLAFFSSLNIESQGQLFKNKLINDRDIMIRVKVCQ